MVKKSTIIILVGMLLVTILSSCDKNINREQDAVVMTPFYEEAYHETQIIYDREEAPNGYCEVFENKLIYKNEELGYSIILPISWKDNFRVEKSEKESLIFYFWGESDVCYHLKTQKREGLRVFLIVNESVYKTSTLESIYYLGTANGVKYYFAKNTDCPICALYDEINDYENGVSIYQDNSEQIELIKEDIRVMEKMKDDLDNIDLDFQELNE